MVWPPLPDKRQQQRINDYYSQNLPFTATAPVIATYVVTKQAKDAECSMLQH
jgi:hypothetical protein